MQSLITTLSGSSARRLRKSLLLWGLTLLVVTAVLAGLAVLAGASPQGAIVRPDPLLSAVPVAGEIVVNLYVQDVQNLYGADLRLGFDPSILEVQDANPSLSGVQIQPLSTFLKPDYVARNKACNTVSLSDSDCRVAGIVRYALTQVNPSFPVTGSGPVAAVTFKRLKPDVATLTIITPDLFDRNGVAIPSKAQDGRVDFVPRKLYLPLIFR
jgi:hypothetical protein